MNVVIHNRAGSEQKPLAGLLAPRDGTGLVTLSIAASKDLSIKQSRLHCGQKKLELSVMNHVE